MNKIEIKGLNEVLFHEELDNKLNVYILKKENYNSFSAYFVTNYGATTNEFVPIGEKEMVKFPNGIAHFLEHKLFEQEEGPNVLSKFASLGASANAFTNYNNTAYYIDGTDNFNECINFLLDYVQSPYFTDENVEKEKGIINQERLMTLDNPYRNFYRKINDNLFVNYRYGKSIVGSKKDIYSITKEDLYRCYNTFYNPSNMTLFIVSGMDENEVLNIVKDNQNKKTFKKQDIIVKKEVKEPNRVSKKYDVIYDNVTKNEIAYSLKIPFKNFSYDEDYTLLYYGMLMGLNFGKMSDFNFELKQKKLIDGNFDCSVEKTNEYLIISITFSSDNYEEVLKLVDEKINNLELNEKKFDLVKKTYISRFIYSFETVNSCMNRFYSDFYYFGKVRTDMFFKYQNINFKDYCNIASEISLKNKSIVIMKPKSNKE